MPALPISFYITGPAVITILIHIGSNFVLIQMFLLNIIFVHSREEMQHLFS